MLKQIISDTANETLPEKENKKRKDWFDLDCSLATTKKNKAYNLMIQKHYTRSFEEYKDLRKQEKRLPKKKKRLFLVEQYREIETLKSQKESRKYYQLINEIRKEFNPNLLVCKNKDGELLNDKNQILERWREHFKDLLHGRDTLEIDNGAGSTSLTSEVV